MYSNDEWLEKWQEVSENIKATENNEPTCICTMNQLLTSGCKCDRLPYERKQKEDKRNEIIKKKRKALNDGVSYEERNKQYGDIKEF